MYKNDYTISVPVGWNGCPSYNPKKVQDDFNLSIPSIFMQPMKKNLERNTKLQQKKPYNMYKRWMKIFLLMHV